MASVPLKPTDVPLLDPTESSSSKIKVTFGTPMPVNGGSPIISLGIEVDDGLGGSFMSI